MEIENTKTYTEAFDELQEIVADMEDSQISIDELDEKIKDSLGLIKICKDKLYKSEQSVKKTLEEINKLNQ